MHQLVFANVQVTFEMDMLALAGEAVPGDLVAYNGCLRHQLSHTCLRGLMASPGAPTVAAAPLSRRCGRHASWLLLSPAWLPTQSLAACVNQELSVVFNIHAGMGPSTKQGDCMHMASPAARAHCLQSSKS